MRSRRQAGLVLVALMVALTPACTASRYEQLLCSDDARQSLLHLTAQAVPSATILACIERLEPGWTYGGSDVRSGLVHFWLDSDRVGPDAIDVRVTTACDLSGDVESPVPGAPGLALYAPVTQHPPPTVRHYVFDGGCATVRFSFTRSIDPAIFDEAQTLLGYEPRSNFVNGVRAETGLTLCGAGAPACPG